MIDLGDARIVRGVETRTLSPENPTGEPGMGARAQPGVENQAHDLGVGWKARPKLHLRQGETASLGEFRGCGVVGRVWMTFSDGYNFAKLGILRAFFDGCPHPSIEAPVGAFFGCAWGRYAQVSSRYLNVNPSLGLECYHTMPFRRSVRFELENIGCNPTRPVEVYYAIDVEVLPSIPDDAGYFGAQYNLSNPALDGLHPVLDVQGVGHWLGVCAAWRANEFNWWGEGMWLAYRDEDEHPTNVWPGTEDFVGGSYDFRSPVTGEYVPYSNERTWFVEYPRPDYKHSARCFGLYRWLSPRLHFDGRLRVVAQVMGSRDSDGAFIKRRDTVATVAAYRALDLPTASRPLPCRADLERF